MEAERWGKGFPLSPKGELVKTMRLVWEKAHTCAAVKSEGKVQLNREIPSLRKQSCSCRKVVWIWLSYMYLCFNEAHYLYSNTPPKKVAIAENWKHNQHPGIAWCALSASSDDRFPRLGPCQAGFEQVENCYSFLGDFKGIPETVIREMLLTLTSRLTFL